MQQTGTMHKTRRLKKKILNTHGLSQNNMRCNAECNDQRLLSKCGWLQEWCFKVDFCEDFFRAVT